MIRPQKPYLLSSTTEVLYFTRMPSKIMIELDPATPADEMPQMWDELRRKILTVQAVLPEGASPILVGDDYGDVFGIYYGLSADPGFTYEEMRDWAQRIKTELVPVDGVQKVTLSASSRTW